MIPDTRVWGGALDTQSPPSPPLPTPTPDPNQPPGGGGVGGGGVTLCHTQPAHRETKTRQSQRFLLCAGTWRAPRFDNERENERRAWGGSVGPELGAERTGVQ